MFGQTHYGRNFRNAVLLGCALSLSSTSLVAIPAANAGMIGTETMVGEDVTMKAETARAKIDSFMARDDVRAEFLRQGVDPREADQRVAAITDAEAIKLATEIENAPAGEGAVGAVVGAALIIFLVLLITDLLGFTTVFPFTKKGSAG